MTFCLTLQVSTLELLCKKNETTIKENEKLIKVQKSEIDKHQELAQLIHSLSGGANAAKQN